MVYFKKKNKDLFHTEILNCSSLVEKKGESKIKLEAAESSCKNSDLNWEFDKDSCHTSVNWHWQRS